LNTRIDLGGKDPNLEVGRLTFKMKLALLKNKLKINFFLLENRGVVTLKYKRRKEMGELSVTF
jgi:hypothetical protein